MKIFTIDEANEMLPVVRPKLDRLKYLYAAVAALRGHAKSAAAASGSGGGGMVGGSIYVEALNEMSKMMSKLGGDGIELKDISRGLIDFPCLRDGRLVLLCWQLGEPESIEWWHEAEAGFAGRQRL
jgi:hypothetical protein